MVEPVELAAFRVGEQVYALPAASVLEAIEPIGLVPLRGAKTRLRGLITYPGSGSEKAQVIPVLDLRDLLGVAVDADRVGAHILVTRAAEAIIGLVVDDVLAVLEVEARQLEPVAIAPDQHGQVVNSFVKVYREALLAILDVYRLALAVVLQR